MTQSSSRHMIPNSISGNMRPSRLRYLSATKSPTMQIHYEWAEKKHLFLWNLYSWLGNEPASCMYICDHVDVALARAYWVTPLNLNSFPFENYIWKLYRNSIISRYCVVHSTLLYILHHVFDVSEISFTQFARWLDVHVKIDLDHSCFPLTLTIMNLARD